MRKSGLLCAMLCLFAVALFIVGASDTVAHAMSAAAPLSMAMSLPLPRAITGTVIRAKAEDDPKIVIAQLNAAFEEFKEAHDKRLDAKADDVVLAEKEERINAAISDLQSSVDKLSIDLAAAQMGAGDGKQIDDPAFTEVFTKYFRTGKGEDEVEAQHKTGPRAAMTRGTDADGGYLAPVEWDRTITHQLREESPIRQNAKTVTISGAGYRSLYATGGTGSGWVGETAARPATTTPQLAPLDFGVGEIYAMPVASQVLLEDSEVDIEQWLADEVEYEFSKQENIAFLSGDGTNKPTGVLTYVNGAANAAKHPYGAIPVVASGASGALSADGIIDIIYDIPTTGRRNAKFFASRDFAKAARKLKDGDGNYLWQPSFQAGQPSLLSGESVVEVPDMPVVAAGNIAALYGDMAQTYTVIDRLGIQILRDPYTNKPFVQFYTRKRVGGGVHNVEYMRALKIDA
ncbi:phage major capsid protein [Notoacmeibacter sp. MSK16QG-6]|uniref:phage major capsid protein n=1 Tax=Notoacmeibacter sp. MSK16QG-6 TaxID=2957982 RepID=UPI0020A1A05B|nr:phage major capsid protein [Notoacmeibacter sp. MSK16QG-6]MCP1200061.1 phage major capsid protein [Notoacmeibacter sp. MSK16QG-6]